MTGKPKLDFWSNQRLRPVLPVMMLSAFRELRQSQYVGGNQGENTSKLYSWTATMWQGGYVGGQHNRIFFRRIYITTEFSSQRSKMLLFLTTNMHARRDVTYEPAIERFHDVTMAILVSQNNETVAMLVFQTSPHSCGSWTFFLCKNFLLFR